MQLNMHNDEIWNLVHNMKPMDSDVFKNKMTKLLMEMNTVCLKKRKAEAAFILDSHDAKK